VTYKKPNIRDVALAAGVSAQTVSRVLNNRSDVAEETRQHVLKIIAELNYSPCELARSMRRNGEILDSNDVLTATGEDIRMAIEYALTNEALTQEKAVWLLEGLEKGFITMDDLSTCRSFKLKTTVLE
jgi:hypothetical protein